MKVYRFPRSRSLKVLWTLEELGASYDSVKVDLLSANRAVESPHPFGKVPYLIDGDISISETLAICIFLCEKYGVDTLYPSDPAEKSRVNSWISFAITDLESSVWGLLKQLLFTTEEIRREDVVNYFREEVYKVVSQLEIDDRTRWIASENFSLADIFMSQTLQWAKFCGIELNEQIDAYLKRTTDRVSYLRAEQLNDA